MKFRGHINITFIIKLQYIQTGYILKGDNSCEMIFFSVASSLSLIQSNIFCTINDNESNSKRCSV